MTCELYSERGIALIVVLMAMLVMAAIGAALALAAATESRISRNFRNNTEALYAADAVLGWGVDQLRGVADWNLLLSGNVRTTFTDGPPGGTRGLVDSQTIDLDAILNDVNCRKVSSCSSAEMDAITADRPWGANNPRWQLFAWGSLSRLVPAAAIDSPFYVVVMVADDSSECDDNPLLDGGAAVSCPTGKVNPGAGVLGVRAEAFGPFGAHRVVEATVARPVQGVEAPELMSTEPSAENNGDTAGSETGPAETGVRILSWRAVK